MISARNLLFNSVTISLPKNMIQFSLGIILYWFILGFPDPGMVVLSLAGFLIAYTSVYLYNDLVDYDEDRKDSEKVKWKLIAGGMISEKTAKVLTVVFTASGLIISLLINRWFFLMILGMLVLNFLHSSPYTRFKKGMMKTTANMTAIEFLKFSCGWFAMTSNIEKFPFWLVLSFSIVYTASYIIYKFKFRGNLIKSKKPFFVFLGAVGVISYIISLISYGFPISMVILVIIPLFVLILLKQIDIEFHKISNMVIIEYLLLPVVIISFAILMIPIFGQANENIANKIGEYRENVMKDLPSDIKQPIENITDELKKYKVLEDIESGLKTGLDNMTKLNHS